MKKTCEQKLLCDYNIVGQRSKTKSFIWIRMDRRSSKAMLRALYHKQDHVRVNVAPLFIDFESTDHMVFFCKK